MTKKKQDKDAIDLINEKMKKSFSFSKVLCIFSMSALIYVLYKFGQIVNAKMNGTISDMSDVATVVCGAFVFTGLSVVFYYNKSRLENSIKIRYSFIEKLLHLKQKLGLYAKEELQQQIDGSIQGTEQETMDSISQSVSNADQEQENIVL